MRSRRREVLVPTLVVSLALHFALLLSLLILRTEPIPLEASAPPAVEVMAEIGTAEGEKPPVPSEAPALPAEALPAAPVPPPPPPPDESEVAAQQAPPPEPPPPVEPPKPPPPPVKPVPVRAPTPARTKAPAPTAVASAGAPPHSTDGVDTASRTDGTNHNPDWMGKLKQWWDQHSFYPKEASASDQGGAVRVRMAIDADGWVKSVEVVHGSGSSVLDTAAIAVFRDVHLPPFPPGTPAPSGDVEVTVRYVPAHG